MATSSFDKNFVIDNSQSLEKLLDIIDAPPSVMVLEARQRVSANKPAEQQAETNRIIEGLKCRLSRLSK